MPISRGAVSASRFRVEGKVPRDVKSWLSKMLERKAFEPIDPKGDEERAAGFTPHEDGSLFEGEFAIFSYRIEKIRVSASAMRGQLDEWSQKFADKNGRPPGRAQKTEQKALIRKSLRARTEPSVKLLDVSYELPRGEVLVWASSHTVVDEITSALEDGLEVRLVPRVPASLVDADTLDAMAPTPELFGEELSRLALAASQPKAED